MTRLRLRHLLPAALVASAGACFATRQDVATLQQDISTVRAEAQRSDSLRRVQLDRVLTTVRAVSDSLTQVGVRLTRFQGEVLGRLTSQDEQLLTIQELTGQSQRRLQELRADLERRGASSPGAGTLGGGQPAGGEAAGGREGDRRGGEAKGAGKRHWLDGLWLRVAPAVISNSARRFWLHALSSAPCAAGCSSPRLWMEMRLSAMPFCTR